MRGNAEESRGDEAGYGQEQFYEDPDDPPARWDDPLKWLPVLWVLGTIVFLYSVYVFFHCIPMLQLDETADVVDNDVRQRAWVELVAVNVFTLMVFICYGMAIVMHPGTIPDNDPRWEYDLPAPDAEVKPVNLHERKRTGDRRHCKWCGKYKPDRCHHCRACRICVLKMDHHCPWIYNCVGFNNYKPFFLVLVYAMLDCQLIVWTMIPSVIEALSYPHVPFTSMFLLLFGETLAFFFCFLVTFFLGFHVWLINQAMTTIEFCEKALPKDGGEANYDASMFSLGCWENFTAVLGPNPLLWFLPFFPPDGDGCDFKRGAAALSKQDRSGDYGGPYGSYGYDSPRNSFAQFNGDEYATYGDEGAYNTPAYGGSIQPPARIFPPTGYHSGGGGYGDDHDPRPSDFVARW